MRGRQEVYPQGCTAAGSREEGKPHAATLHVPLGRGGSTLESASCLLLLPFYQLQSSDCVSEESMSYSKGILLPPAPSTVRGQGVKLGTDP